MKIRRFVLLAVFGLGIASTVPMKTIWAHGDETGVKHMVEDMTVDRTASIPNPPPGKIAMRLSVTYVQDSLPGEGIQYFEMSPEADGLWAMESLPKGEALPVGKSIKDRVLFLSPSEAKGVTIAYRNPTRKEVKFTFLPHREVPAARAPDTWLTCLCMAFVYKAPPGGSWYRVVKLKVSPDIPVGSKIDVVWPVLTDPAVLPEGN